MKTVRAFLFVFLTLAWLAGCDSAPRYQPLPPDAVVLAFGDSITYGTGAGGGQDYPHLLAGLSEWRVVNAGVPGDTAQQARERLPALLAEHRPELVIVELGGNDFLRKRREADVKGDILAIIDEIQASGALVALVAVPRLSLLRAGMGALRDSSIYAEMAQVTEVLLIPEVLSSVLSEDHLRADQIHPNAEGYRVLASGLVEVLRSEGLMH